MSPHQGAEARISEGWGGSSGFFRHSLSALEKGRGLCPGGTEVKYSLHSPHIPIINYKERRIFKLHYNIAEWHKNSPVKPVKNNPINILFPGLMAAWELKYSCSPDGVWGHVQVYQQSYQHHIHRASQSVTKLENLTKNPPPSTPYTGFWDAASMELRYTKLASSKDLPVSVTFYRHEGPGPAYKLPSQLFYFPITSKNKF